MQWFTKNGFQVMGAYGIKPAWNLMPQDQSNAKIYVTLPKAPLNK